MESDKKTVARGQAKHAKAINGSAKGDDPRTQAEKFEAVARELGCDEDEDRFKGVLRKLTKPTSDKPKS